jgi:hypothetical protein
MKVTIKIYLIFAFIICFSCEDRGLFVKCPDCTTDEPKDTSLKIKLDGVDSGLTTQINVYEGNAEDSVLYDSFKTFSSEASVTVTLNKKYTVTATYFIHDNYYIAFDSATPRVRYDKKLCDNPCYFVYDRDIDLRLKYTK